MYSIIHASMEPLIYSIVISYGLVSMGKKLKAGKVMQLAIEIAIFALIFALHGGSVTGGFASTIASVVAGNILAKMFEPNIVQMRRDLVSFFATCKSKLGFQPA